MSIATWQAMQERSVDKFMQDEIGALRKAYDNSTAEIDRLRGVLAECVDVMWIEEMRQNGRLPVDKRDRAVLWGLALSRARIELENADLADGEGRGSE